MDNQNKSNQENIPVSMEDSKKENHLGIPSNITK